ncbi:MAG: response regulator [Ignavibacteriales bacterium]
MSLKILIGDKDKNDRNIIKKILEGLGRFEIIETDEVREFIGFAINKSPDIAFMDINLQPQNGKKVIEIVRSTQSNSRLPIVVITHAVERDEILSLLRLGITDLILKPIYNNTAADKIRTAINSLLGSGGGRTTGASADNVAVPAMDATGKEKFLLIDHDRQFRNVFMKLFSEKYEVIIAENGEEGLELFERKRPEYIFLGEHIKIINERVLVQKIRAIDPGTVKIYFLSTVLKSTSMKSSLFNGVIEKYSAPDLFYKEFSKVVFGEETNLYQKTAKIVRGTLPQLLGNIITQGFKDSLGADINLLPEKSTVTIPNETLAFLELIDDKKELSVTLGVYGTSNDMLKIAEKVLGEQVPLNAKAVEAIGGVVTTLSSGLNQFFSGNGISLAPVACKVNSKLENKLNYDWDVTIPIKTSSNEQYQVGVYCTKYIA